MNYIPLFLYFGYIEVYMNYIKICKSLLVEAFLNIIIPIYRIVVLKFAQKIMYIV